MLCLYSIYTESIHTMKYCCGCKINTVILPWSSAVSCFRKELLNIQNMAILSLQRTCQSIASSKKQVPQQRKGSRSKISPSLPKHLLQTESQVMGLHIRQNILSWAVIQGDSTIQNWNCVRLPLELTVAKLHEIINAALTIADILEVCDMHVIEEHEFSTKALKKEAINLHMQQNQFYGILMSCFVQRRKPDTIPQDASNVYIMRNGTTAKHFSLKIGYDILTTDYVIQPLLPTLQMADDIKTEYLHRGKMEKEEMNWALLKTLTFLQICKGTQQKPRKAKEKNIDVD